jgi:hypothetical protein
MNVITDWLHKATIWDWMTNVTGFIAIGMLALLIFGFRRYVRRPREAPIDFIGTGIWMMALFQMMRMFYWDILPDVLDVSWKEDYGITGSHINWFFNILIIIGVWFKLKGYWIIVDDKAPGQYSIFTAVFYPKRLRLWLESKNEITSEKE